MIANYHTHTYRCNHASGTELQYVQAAVDSGLKTLGFSDHSPYVFPKDHESRFRMRIDQLEDYVNCILNLKKSFSGVIDIPLGLEMEYYPKYLPELLSILRDYPMDYFLLGQHFIGSEVGEPYSGARTGDVGVLRRYCDQTIDAMQSGLYTYFAHPDLLFFVGDSKTYTAEVRRICREAKNCNIPLEINLLGMTEGRHYPNPLFWETAAEENCTVILGRDAHKAEAFFDKRAEEKALAMIDNLNLNLIAEVDLRKPF